MSKFVLDRSRWLRGEEDSYLRRPRDGKMCCLGLYLESCGVDPLMMTGIFYPGSPSVKDLVPEEARWTYRGGPGPSGSSIATVNDSVTLRPSQREEMISQMFGMHGVEVEFVDKPATDALSASGQGGQDG